MKDMKKKKKNLYYTKNKKGIAIKSQFLLKRTPEK